SHPIPAIGNDSSQRRDAGERDKRLRLLVPPLHVGIEVRPARHVRATRPGVRFHRERLLERLGSQVGERRQSKHYTPRRIATMHATINANRRRVTSPLFRTYAAAPGRYCSPFQTRFCTRPAAIAPFT